MEELVLEAQIRDEIGKGRLNALRRQGFVPAVVYGPGIKSLNVKILRRSILQFIHQHHIETAVFNLVVKDRDKRIKQYTCMIKEIQYHPLTDDILHVDFNHISLSKLIKVKVPVVPKGEPVGVKQEGGIFNRLLWEIEVECLPSKIPEQIEVDVSNLKINESIQIKDIGQLGEGIKILASEDTIIFSVSPPVKEEVVVEAPAEERVEPEVIKEKKEVPKEESAETKE